MRAFLCLLYGPSDEILSVCVICCLISESRRDPCHDGHQHPSVRSVCKGVFYFLPCLIKFIKRHLVLLGRIFIFKSRQKLSDPVHVESHPLDGIQYLAGLDIHEYDI